jgi:hypothetical protein
VPAAAVQIEQLGALDEIEVTDQVGVLDQAQVLVQRVEVSGPGQAPAEQLGGPVVVVVMGMVAPDFPVKLTVEDATYPSWKKKPAPAEAGHRPSQQSGRKRRDAHGSAEIHLPGGTRPGGADPPESEGGGRSCRHSRPRHECEHLGRRFEQEGLGGGGIAGRDHDE